MQSRYVDATSRTTVGIACALLILGVISGCGPIRSTQQINDAKVAFERARVADSYSNAPYKFFRAQYYLHKAKEEWGYSEFEASYDYATEAERAAEAALRKSEEDPWNDPIPSRSRTYELEPYRTITAGDAEREIERLESKRSGSGRSNDDSDSK
jgi:hypothetical protein